MEPRFRHLWRHGLELAQQRGWPESIEYFLRLVEIAPEWHEAKVQAATLLLHQDRYREARALTLAAVGIDRRAAPLAVEIAKLLRCFEEPETLAGVLERVDWSDCESLPLLYEAARLFATSGLHGAALTLVERALLLAPHSAHGFYMRGSIRMFAGDSAGARADFRESLELVPEQPHVHWMLSLQSESEYRPIDVGAIRALQPQTQLDSEGGAYLGFALHNHLHADGNIEESWQALENACAVKRRLIGYSRERHHALFGALHEWQSLGSPNASARADDPGLIFIVGMHRSGTTLLERVLSGHSQVTDGGESYAFSAQMAQATDHRCQGVVDEIMIQRAAKVDWDEIARGYRDYARWRAAGRAWLTEKLPSNFLNLGFILKALPEAKILHMVRDPLDTCFSNLRTYFAQAAGYSYDQADLADYYRRYRRLMAHWHATAPGRILDVDYAALVAAPEREARRALDFCRLSFEPQVLDVGRAGGVVATASVAYGRDGFRRDRSAAWKPYSAHLRTLLEGLEGLD